MSPATDAPLPQVRSVLIVEDDRGQAIALELRFQDLGIPEVHVAHSADAALEIAHTRKIDLLVCDLGLPGRDGMSLLRELSSHPQPPAVILLSGVDRGLLETVGRLVTEIGLRLLGGVSKPISDERLTELLALANRIGAQGRLPASVDEALPDAVLKAGIAAGWYRPYYEARIAVATGQVEGVEMLARLSLPNGVVIPPVQFIERLEALGLIDTLTWQLTDQALGFLARCRGQGLAFGLSINVSPLMLGDDRVLDNLDARIARHGLHPRDVILEVTESVAFELDVDTVERLVHLRLGGYGLSIDDFGTGFSSLSRLSKLPFTELKIDRSFVVGAVSDHKARTLFQTSVEMAKRLGLQVCAEGVEDQAVLDLAASFGIDTAQGYHFHRPMGEDAFLEWLRARNAG